MEPAEILDNTRNLERFDYVARRNFGLENQSTPNGPLTLAFSEVIPRFRSSTRPDWRRSRYTAPDWRMQSIAFKGRVRCNRRLVLWRIDLGFLRFRGLLGVTTLCK